MPLDGIIFESTDVLPWVVNLWFNIQTVVKYDNRPNLRDNLKVTGWGKSNEMEWR